MHDNTKMLPLEFWSVAMGNSICTNSKAMVSKKIQGIVWIVRITYLEMVFFILGFFFTDTFKFFSSIFLIFIFLILGN